MKQGDVDVEVKKSHDVKVKKPDVRDISSNVDDGNTQNVPDDCNTQNVPDDCNTQNVKDVESTVQSSELRLMFDDVDVFVAKLETDVNKACVDEE